MQYSCSPKTDSFKFTSFPSDKLYSYEYLIKLDQPQNPCLIKNSPAFCLTELVSNCLKNKVEASQFKNIDLDEKNKIILNF